ncbi:hypothetical protein EZ444_25990 [Pedobacter hiemivivus]|uniref:Uncharacterized protein n=2 Tax=Pedobacter hiemivivus TaxID=2530454 RepID=A0A4R0MCQ9_9SPHI|nr:hypothetical protein EZ444_25990 [Pedobacter hiemivivus]
MMCLLIISCKKNDPIGDLGETNNEFATQLRVTYNSTKLVMGDTLVISASTWQRDDKFQKIDIYETVVETFGINMTLKSGTSVLTKTADESTLTVLDSVLNKGVLLEVFAADMDKYWTTASNNYVIRQLYPVKVKVGKYANDVTLIQKLNDADFGVLKSILSFAITKSDYLLLFPTAPAGHFGGATVLSPTGRENLKQNLTRPMLTAIVQTIKKVGSYNLIIDVAAMTQTNTITASTQKFEINL